MFWLGKGYDQLKREEGYVNGNCINNKSGAIVNCCRGDWWKSFMPCHCLEFCFAVYSPMLLLPSPAGCRFSVHLKSSRVIILGLFCCQNMFWGLLCHDGGKANWRITNFTGKKDILSLGRALVFPECSWMLPCADPKSRTVWLTHGSSSAFIGNLLKSLSED